MYSSAVLMTVPSGACHKGVLTRLWHYCGLQYSGNVDAYDLKRSVVGASKKLSNALAGLQDDCSTRRSVSL
jgi:hypothetical protein